MDDFAQMLGIEVFKLKYAVGLIGQIPLAFFHKKLKSTQSKELFSLVAGIGLSFVMFGLETIHFFITAIISYLMVQNAPLKYSPFLVSVFNLTYLGYGHFIRQYYHYLEYSLDWTLPQMMICVKLSSFAWEYYDGQLPIETIKSEYRKSKRIEKLPSLMDYLSYVFFFAGFLAGPFATYRDYNAFSTLEMFKSTNGVIPSSRWAVMKKVAIAVSAFFGSQIGERFPADFMLTDEFLKYSFLDRVLYMYASAELNYCKYYFAFSLGEATCQIVGISYNGTDPNGNVLWNRTEMFRIWEWKKSTNHNQIANSWNIPNQRWLRYHNYERIVAVAPRIVGVIATFTVSAIWHGFYPGYYLFFVSCGMLYTVASKMKSTFRPIFLNKDGTARPGITLYRIGGWIITWGTLDYLVASFNLLAFDRSMKAWSAVYFFIHIGAVIFYIFLVVFGGMIQRIGWSLQGAKQKDQ